MTRLRKLVLERLMRYYRFLSESTGKKTPPTITSAEIARALDVDPTQVRKDFGAIGLMGMGRVGFDRCEVCRSIRVVLGFDQPYEAVLIGAGHLGSAMLSYGGFATYGLTVVAAFDRDRRLVGRKIAGHVVKPMNALKPFLEKTRTRLAILATPADVSQALADRLVACGVKAIWNFSPTRLAVPAGVLVRNEHMSLGLSEIAYHLKQNEESD